MIIATPPHVTAIDCAGGARGRQVRARREALAPTTGRDTAGPVGRAGCGERLQIGLTYRHHPRSNGSESSSSGGALGTPLLVQVALCDEPATPETDPVAYEPALAFARRAPRPSSPTESTPATGSTTCSAPPRSRCRVGACAAEPSFASPNINGGVLTYADGTVARVEVVWLVPVLPSSQFVVTGPLGRAMLDPPTFDLDVRFADGRHEQHEPPGDKTEVCFRLQLQAFLDHVLAGHAARARARPRRSRASSWPSGSRSPAARCRGSRRDRLPHPSAARRRVRARRRSCAAWTRSGVDLSVVFTYEGLLRPSPAANDSLAAFVSAAPERLVAFATVDPRDPGAAAEIERCVYEHGMRGVKLHPVAPGLLGARAGARPGLRGGGRRSGCRCSSTTGRRRSRRRSSSRPRATAPARRPGPRSRRAARPLAGGDRRGR